MIKSPQLILGACIVVAAIILAITFRYEYEVINDGRNTLRIDRWTSEICRRFNSEDFDWKCA